MATICRGCDQQSDQPRKGWCSSCEWDRLPAWQRAEHQRLNDPGSPLTERPKEIPAGSKWCPACRHILPVKDFGAGGKPAAYCSPCTSTKGLERTVAEFGLTVEQYDALSAAQGHRCAICRGEPGKRRLAIDHNHVTGEVRGLLDSYCNDQRLRAFRHDPEMLRRAADYLENPPSRGVLKK